MTTTEYTPTYRDRNPVPSPWLLDYAYRINRQVVIRWRRNGGTRFQPLNVTAQEIIDSGIY